MIRCAKQQFFTVADSQSTYHHPTTKKHLHASATPSSVMYTLTHYSLSTVLLHLKAIQVVLLCALVCALHHVAEVNNCIEPLYLLLRTPIVVLIAAAEPTEGDYTLATCNAYSRAEAIGYCQQQLPVGRFRLVTPVTAQQRTFARSTAVAAACATGSNFFVDAVYLQNDGSMASPQHKCQWSSGPDMGGAFECFVFCVLCTTRQPKSCWWIRPRKI